MANSIQEFPPEDAPGIEDPGVFRFKRTHVYSVLIPLAFVAGLASGFLFWGRDSRPSAPSGGQNEVVAVDVDDDPFLGDEDAEVTIIEFGDFSCSFCKRFHDEILPELLEEYGDSIRFVYRDFPIVGGGAVGAAAAHAANCAAEQDAYWDYHAALFSGDYGFTGVSFDQYAEDLGLDLEAFQDCQDDNRYTDEIIGDYTAGRQANVTGTPTFFINGRRLVGAQPATIFSQIIDEELGN